MTTHRRAVLTVALGLGLAGGGAFATAGEPPMAYGLTGSIIAVSRISPEERFMSENVYCFIVRLQRFT